MSRIGLMLLALTLFSCSHVPVRELKIVLQDDGGISLDDSSLKVNEGVLYLKVNSEINETTIVFRNVETMQTFQLGKQIGRYKTYVVALPAGEYQWFTIKANATYFKSDESKGSQFEVLPRKLNYPGDIDVVIASRTPPLSIGVYFVDREDSLPDYLQSLTHLEFHYSRLFDDEGS